MGCLDSKAAHPCRFRDVEVTQKGHSASPPLEGGESGTWLPRECNVCQLTGDVLVVTETDMAPQGFEDTYREHRLALVRLAFLMCGSRDASEDLVQSVFTSAHPRWHEIDNHLAYLRRAVVNLAKDGQRRHFRRLRVPPPPHPEPVTAIPELDETWALIQRLPSAQRAVVVLHYYEDLPLVEVATILDRPASTVRSDLRRALDRLRKALT